MHIYSFVCLCIYMCTCLRLGMEAGGKGKKGNDDVLVLSEEEDAQACRHPNSPFLSLSLSLLFSIALSLYI